MAFAIPAIVIFLGLCFGSMVTLVSYRLPREEPVGNTRSRCPSCKKTLGVRDLVPLFSWIISGGKCRQCKAKISSRYPLTEICTGALFYLVYLEKGVSFEAAVLMMLATGMMILIVTDLEHYIIPDEIQILYLLLGGIYHFAIRHTPIEEPLGGLLVGILIGASLQLGYRYLRKKEGLGTGDVKFLASAGLWLGLKPLVPFFVFSGLLGIVSGLLWRALGFGKIFPFGPALAIAMFVLILYPQSEQWFWESLQLLSTPSR